MMTKGKSVKEINDKSICLECKKLFPYVIGGSFIDLKENGWLPRKDLDRVDINTPINWNHPDDNACFNLHAWRFMSAVWSHYIKEPCYQSAHEAVFFNLGIIPPHSRGC